MIGQPKSEASITGIIIEKASIIGTIRSSSILADIEPGKIEIIHTNLPDFDGPFYIEPASTVQTLSTTNKTVRHNIVVDAIRYVQYPNSAGGFTAYIGKER